MADYQYIPHGKKTNVNAYFPQRPANRLNILKTLYNEYMKNKEHSELTGRVTGYKIEQFFGLSNGYVSKYVKRGEIIRGNDGKIPTDNPVNVAFLQKLMVRHRPTDANNKEVVERFELDLELKQLDIEKRKQEIKYLRLRNAKAEGKTLPADEVKGVFRRFGKSVTTAFHQSMENELVRIGQEQRLSGEQTARLRKEIKNTANSGITGAVRLSKKEAAKLVSDE